MSELPAIKQRGTVIIRRSLSFVFDPSEMFFVACDEVVAVFPAVCQRPIVYRNADYISYDILYIAETAYSVGIADPIRR